MGPETTRNRKNNNVIKQLCVQTGTFTPTLDRSSRFLFKAEIDGLKCKESFVAVCICGLVVLTSVVTSAQTVNISLHTF